LKYFIFSDLHGNQYVIDSLKKALNYYKPETVVFLGDVFGYYYGYRKCIEFLNEISAICLMGNHDNYAMRILLGDFSLLPFVVSKYGNSYNKILDDRSFCLNYLIKLKKSYNTQCNGTKIFFTHGSITDPLEGRVYQNTSINLIDFRGNDIVFSGHTHHKFIRVIEGKLWVNVGSSGQPRDGQLPIFVLFNSQSGLIQFNNIQFNKDSLILELLNNDDFKLPHSSILNRLPPYESIK